MVTFVGTQKDFGEALQELIDLEYAAVDAYEAAIKRLENMDYQKKLEEFKEDHQKHIEGLSELLKKTKQEVPEKGRLGKQVLTTGKVLLATMLGDETILQAMKSNEIDTNTAYERMSAHDEKWPEANLIIQQGLNDEKRHKAWLDKILSGH